MLIIGVGSGQNQNNRTGWRRQNPVPNNELSAPFCALGCKNEGFRYFSLECPRENGVECMCADEVGPVTVDSRKCKEFNRDGPSRCRGQFTQYFAGDEYCLGAGNYIAAYEVESRWLTTWLNENQDVNLVSTAVKPTAFAVFVALVYQLL
jgi:hypothetical protein